MLCVVLGVPGVGKTTVLDVAAKTAKFKVLNFGDYMFAEAKREGLVKDRDYMRKLPRMLQIALQQKAAEKIHSESKHANLIVDTHASVKTRKGYMPGLPEVVLRALNPDVFVLIEGKGDDIYGRRNKDRSRHRDSDTVDMIQEHQEIDRAFAATYAYLSTSSVVIVKNEEGKVKESGETIAKLFK